MIRIRTPSRLHFGLISLPTDKAMTWRNQENEPALPWRPFGGIGLMIDGPGITLSVAPRARWSAEGPLAQRALGFAQRYCAALGIADAFHLHIEAAAPEHAGLGTGTQLALAVARAVAELTAQPARTALALAPPVGRGLRSALGIHGFEHGGLLVEGGKGAPESISPLLARHDFPAEWEILLMIPRGLQGTHGGSEVAAFADLVRQQHQERAVETLCRLILLHLLPALLERDLTTFGAALYDFNRRVGALFESAQGGIYAHPRIEQLVQLLRAAGLQGIGQSSWGPALFAISTAGHLEEVRGWLLEKNHLHAEEIRLTRACNHGATIEW